MALTASLPSIENDLVFAEERARRLAAGISQSQANWQPNGGRSWSIVQCLSHLARTNRIYAAAIHEALSRPGAPRLSGACVISPGRLGAWFIRSLEPPPRARVKAPTTVRPPERGDLQEAVDEFLSSHQGVRAAIQSAAGIDLNRLRFKNPFIPVLRWTVSTGLLIINAHDRRHLWQAERVKGAPGYPAN